MDEQQNNQAVGTEVNSPMPPKTPSVNDEIYVMPDKFHPTKSGGDNRTLIIAGAVLLVVVIASVSYFIYESQISKSAQEEENIIEETTPSTQNTRNLITETPTAEEATTTEETTTTGEETAASSTPVVLAMDTDDDGLTDLEESLFSTALANPDTDGDGYKDGEEVINNYDPNRVGNYRLEQTDLVKRWNAGFASDNFDFLSPVSWQVSFVEASRQATILSDTGEIIRLSVKENTLAVPAADWYLDGHPEVFLSDLKPITAGALEGIISPDGLEAYLVNPAKTKIYSFEYLPPVGAQIRYPDVFRLVIKSFRLAAAGLPASQASTTATTTAQ